MITYSIIIASNKGYITLEKLLNSIIDSNIHKDQYEVIIIENGAISSREKLFNQFSIKINLAYEYFISTGFSAAIARNKGIRLAKGKVFIFLDDDVILSKNCLERHIKHHSEDDCPKVVIGVRNSKFVIDGNLSSNKSKFEVDYRINAVKTGKFKDYIWYLAYTCNLSINFGEKIEYFDEEFNLWGNEDQELAYRLFKNSSKFIFDDLCCVYSFNDRNLKNPFLREKYNLEFDYKEFLITRFYFLMKHFDDCQLRLFLIEDLKKYYKSNNKWNRSVNPVNNFDINKFKTLLFEQ